MLPIYLEQQNQPLGCQLPKQAGLLPCVGMKCQGLVGRGWAGAPAGRAPRLLRNSSGEEGADRRPPSPQAAVEWRWNPMFILSPGNYRKCSTHVRCIIVFAVVIGKAWAGHKESEVLETLCSQCGEHRVDCEGIELLYQGPDPCLRDSEHP